MPKPPPKRILESLDALTTTPPPELPPTQSLARIVSASGKNLFTCRLPDDRELLAELASVFRGRTWLIRGGYVLVDTDAFSARKNKIAAEIVNIVRNEREWRKMPYWPAEFVECRNRDDDSEEEEESLMGAMPSDGEGG